MDKQLIQRPSRRDFIKYSGRAGAAFVAFEKMRAQSLLSIVAGVSSSGGGGGGAIALVDHASITGNSASSAINTTGATLLVAVTVSYNPSGASTVTDSKTNTWTALTTYKPTGASNNTTIWYAANPTVGTGHTFTDTTGNFNLLCVAAFSGVSSSPFETGTDTGLNGGLVSSIQPGSVTPAGNGELIISAGSNDGGAALLIDSSFIITDQVQAAVTAYQGGLAYLIQSTAAAVNPSWSWVGNANAASGIAVFR